MSKNGFYLEPHINYNAIENIVVRQAMKSLYEIGALITSDAKKNVRNNVLKTANSEHYKDALRSYGELRNSITFVVKGTVLLIFTNVEYAVYQEYGTGRYVDPSTGYEGRQSGWLFTVKDKSGKNVTIFTYGNYPHPFLRPALFTNTKKAIAIFKKNLNQVRT